MPKIVFKLVFWSPPESDLCNFVLAHEYSERTIDTPVLLLHLIDWKHSQIYLLSRKWRRMSLNIDALIFSKLNTYICSYSSTAALRSSTNFVFCGLPLLRVLVNDTVLNHVQKRLLSFMFGKRWPHGFSRATSGGILTHQLYFSWISAS